MFEIVDHHTLYAYVSDRIATDKGRETGAHGRSTDSVHEYPDHDTCRDIDRKAGDRCDNEHTCGNRDGEVIAQLLQSNHNGDWNNAHGETTEEKDKTGGQFDHPGVGKQG